MSDLRIARGRAALARLQRAVWERQRLCRQLHDAASALSSRLQEARLQAQGGDVDAPVSPPRLLPAPCSLLPARPTQLPAAQDHVLVADYWHGGDRWVRAETETVTETETEA